MRLTHRSLKLDVPRKVVSQAVTYRDTVVCCRPALHRGTPGTERSFVLSLSPGKFPGFSLRGTGQAETSRGLRSRRGRHSGGIFVRMPAVCVWAPSCSSKSKRTVDVLPELQHCFRRPPLRAPLCASHLKAYHLMRKQVQLCLRRERGAQIFSRALNTLLTHTDKISDPRSRRKPSYSFLTVILQMALSVACEKHLALRDEQSVTYSSRAGSPPRALFAAPEPNPGSQYSSRANSVSSDPTPMDVFSQSGSYHEEPMDERESGMADIPATHLPSIDDLGLPPCCANWAVTGRHGLIMLQCTPEDARHAFEAERASGRFCMATALAELAQAIRRAAPNVPTSGDSFAAFCHSAGPACRALHEHVKAATTCGSRSERRRNRDDATVATALCMLAHAANQNATSGVLEQFGLLLEPTAKRAGILHHYGLTPSPTTRA